MARILIINNDPQILDVLGQTLKREGYEVIEALDGEEGLKLYRETPADLVITNMIIAETEGIDIVMELQQEFPDVKIIAIFGGGKIDPEEYLYVARTLGIQKTFAKPFSLEELLKAINELFS